jgi:hypothetical protein
VELYSWIDEDDADMSMLKLHCCLLGIFLQTIAPPVAAQLYKWTDAQGMIHYTDKARDASGGRATEVKVAPAQASANIQAGLDWREREADYQRRKPSASTAQPSYPRVGSNGVPPNNASSGYSFRACEQARNVLSGKPERNNRDAAAPRDRTDAAREAKSSCGN